MRLGPKTEIFVSEFLSSPATQRIRQNFNPSSFFDRKRPLDPSRKNSQGPPPQIWASLEQSHPICIFLPS